MAEDRLKTWETLFQRALVLIDSAQKAEPSFDYWTFGGGTVLMRRHHHRFSKDIDIFVPDPQYLGHLTPRLNDTAESMTNHYDEQGNALKLYFPEGEIDFVAAGPLTHDPFVTETLFGQTVRVETSSEVVAKKIWHRGQQFKARDILDLAMVSEKESQALQSIMPIIREKQDVILARMETQDSALREEFGALEVLDYRRSYDDCAELIRKLFK